MKPDETQAQTVEQARQHYCNCCGDECVRSMLHNYPGLLCSKTLSGEAVTQLDQERLRVIARANARINELEAELAALRAEQQRLTEVRHRSSCASLECCQATKHGDPCGWPQRHTIHDDPEGKGHEFLAGPCDCGAAALRAESSAQVERKEKKDHGAGLIHQAIPDVEGTEPRLCNCKLCEHVTDYEIDIANTIDVLKTMTIHPEYENLVDDLAHMCRVVGKRDQLSMEPAQAVKSEAKENESNDLEVETLKAEIERLTGFVDRFTPLAERLSAMRARAEAAEARLAALDGVIADTHNNLTMILAHAREGCERLNAVEFPEPAEARLTALESSPSPSSAGMPPSVEEKKQQVVEAAYQYGDALLTNQPETFEGVQKACDALILAVSAHYQQEIANLLAAGEANAARCPHCFEPLTCNMKLREEVSGLQHALDQAHTRAEAAEAALSRLQQERS